MFGYITIFKDELKIKDYNMYKSYYCGLCHSLGENFGMSGRMTLSYDMTFLAIVLSALYEDNPEAVKRRCIPHPVKTHEARSNQYTDYAAAMNVMLTYYKLKDDWEDEGSLKKNALSGLLKRAFKKANKQYPRQARAIEEYIKSQHEIEKNNEKSIDIAATPTGKMLGELFVFREDEWQQPMRRFGFYLGKFIYMMDAFDDIEKDIKKNNYNPLLAEYDKEGFEKSFHDDLTLIASQSARAFESLPILENSDILRNILYVGIWCRFNQICDKRNKQD